MTPRARGAFVVAALAILAAGAVLVVSRRLPAPSAAKSVAVAHPASTWTDAEKRAIDDAVSGAASGTPKLSLRPAVDADSADSDEHRQLEAVYGGYHPFFARGDLDGDGRLDFVQGFVESGRDGAWFHVAAFFGRADGTFEKPVWVERSISLAEGDITVERSLVVITPDLAADWARRWRWERSDRVFVDPDVEPRLGGAADEDTPEETPEQKPRARI